MNDNSTQRQALAHADVNSDSQTDTFGVLPEASCSASLVVSLREYDRVVANYYKLRMAMIGDVLPEMSDGYTLLRTDWKVEER